MNKQTTNKKPIKRHKALQPLSRDHHHTLLLVWKIRRGLNTGIEPQRIKTYVDWFYKTYATAHFEFEEKYVYPVLNASDELVVKALEEHRHLKELFQNNSTTPATLSALADSLEEHIRFEERVLFNVIQDKATDGQLRFIEQTSPDEKFAENEADCFWL